MLNKDCRKISEVVGFIIYLNDLMSTSHSYCLTCKKVCLGITVAIDRKHILASFEMTFLKRLLAYRDEFAFIIGGSRRFGKTLDLSWPENVLLSLPQPVNIGFEGIIIIQGYAAPEFLIGLDRPEIILFSEFGVFGRLKQFTKPLLLHFHRVLHEQLDLVNALFHQPGNNRVDQSHRE